jgi:hypothetical protein
MKRIVTSAIVLAIIVVAFAGCGDGGKAEKRAQFTTLHNEIVAILNATNQSVTDAQNNGIEIGQDVIDQLNSLADASNGLKQMIDDGELNKLSADELDTVIAQYTPIKATAQNLQTSVKQLIELSAAAAAADEGEEEYYEYDGEEYYEDDGEEYYEE